MQSCKQKKLGDEIVKMSSIPAGKKDLDDTNLYFVARDLYEFYGKKWSKFSKSLKTLPFYELKHLAEVLVLRASFTAAKEHSELMSFGIF